MALIVETGAGIHGAESYVSVSAADAYWQSRPQNAMATTWASMETDDKEGALREATGFLDGVWGAYYRGIRAGYVQGLLWPRSGAYDGAGYPLPGLPQEIVNATIELAGRAVSATLAVDADRGGEVKRTRKKVGDLEKEIEYFDNATVYKQYGVVGLSLGPVLNGSQPENGGASWFWR